MTVWDGWMNDACEKPGYVSKKPRETRPDANETSTLAWNGTRWGLIVIRTNGLARIAFSPQMNRRPSSFIINQSINQSYALARAVTVHHSRVSLGFPHSIR
jgi:hypothetical protein